MERRDFLKTMALLPLAGAAMKLNAFHKMTNVFERTETMPVLFLGHGNPMNAITENEFAKGFQKQGKLLAKPTAILCISAHWETKGTFVTAMTKPKTIHDFGGFPKALFDVQYPAAGNPDLAKETQKIITKTNVGLDHDWGLDHGCWSVVKHLYPKADIPVIQMSIDYTKPAQWHYELAKELSTLRKKGVLIIGSGNIVHNLGILDWENKKIFDWAQEANEKVKDLIRNNEHQKLANYKSLGKEVQMAIPTPEHFLPLIYALGLKEEKENVSFFNDKIEMGSIAMTSVKFEKA
jgi:4,5-DOPA dioxygenase extradiol